MAERSEFKRQLVQGSTLGVGVILALVLFALVNYLSARHYKRFDVTSSQLYSLSAKSQHIVSQLDQDVELIQVIGAGAGGELFEALGELLSRYETANPTYVKKRVVDVARQPAEALRLNVSEGTAAVVISGEDKSFIEQFDLAEYDYSGAQYGQPPALQEFKGEQLITSAILELVEGTKPEILFTTGHGEAPLAPGNVRSLSAVRDYMEKNSFKVDTWQSVGESEVPAGTDLVVLADPQQGFLESERELLQRYLDGGGRMLVLLEPGLGEAGFAGPDLGGWLRRYGVELGDDLVLDPASRLAFAGPENIAVDAFGTHPIVDPLVEQPSPVLFSLARSVRKAADAPAEMTVTELIKTSDEGWAETNLTDAAVLDGDDVAGPVSLGVAVSFSVETADGGAESSDDTASDAVVNPDDPTGDDAAAGDEETETVSGAGEARLAVYGDLEFLADHTVSNAGNSTLLINTLNWLVQREHLITIETRPPEQTSLSLSRGELTNVYLWVLVFLPGLAVVAGVWVYSRRRR